MTHKNQSTASNCMESGHMAVFCRVAPSRGLIPPQLQLLGQSLQDWTGRHGFPNTGIFACLAGVNDLLDGEYSNQFFLRVLKCYRCVSALFGQEPMTTMPIDEGARLIAPQWGVHPNSREAIAMFEHDDPTAIEADFRRSINSDLVKAVVCEFRSTWSSANIVSINT
jgi:hypothetical protein